MTAKKRKSFSFSFRTDEREHERTTQRVERASAHKGGVGLKEEARVGRRASEVEMASGSLRRNLFFQADLASSSLTSLTLPSLLLYLPSKQSDSLHHLARVLLRHKEGDRARVAVWPHGHRGRKTLDRPCVLQSGEATCSEGFVVIFLKVPLACLGSMAGAV